MRNEIAELRFFLRKFFAFRTCYVHEIFTLTSLPTNSTILYKLWTPSAIMSNLLMKLRTMIYTFFIDTLVSHTGKSFSDSVYRENFAIFLKSRTRSCNPSSKKMVAFYTFVNQGINISSHLISYNPEILYLIAIAFHRNYNPSIVNKVLFKLQKFLKAETHQFCL